MLKTINKLSIFIVLIIAISISSCKDKTIDENIFSQNTPTQNEQEFTLKNSNGKEITILVKEPHKIQMLTKEFQNKAILLDFWATWCPPCVKEIPHLNKLSKKYKGKIEFIGALAEEDKSAISLNKFIKKHKIVYNIATTDENNENIKLLKALTNLRTLPFKVLYDANGTYVNHYYGAIPEEILDRDIQKAIKK